MGSQSSKATADITNTAAASIVSNCDVGGNNTNQKAYCNFNLGPGCNNSKFDCSNNSALIFSCTNQSIQNAVQAAFGNASASTQAAAISSWGNQTSTTNVTNVQQLSEAVAKACTSDGNFINQMAGGTINCTDANNDVVDIHNNSDAVTQCALNTIQSLAQTSTASATSKATKTGLLAGLIVLVVIIVVVVVVVVKKKKKGGGGGGASGGGGIELVNVPGAGAAPAAPVTAPVAAPAPAVPVVAPVAPGTAPAAPAAGGRYGWRQERYW
jgi:hypothetical protein